MNRRDFLRRTIAAAALAAVDPPRLLRWSSGTTLYFPPGEYVIPATIEFPLSPEGARMLRDAGAVDHWGDETGTAYAAALMRGLSEQRPAFEAAVAKYREALRRARA